jgi:site-specific DNA-methyltransferase (adenine-specific)
MTSPYYQDDQVTLYCGDMREVIPELGITADLICTDPPYGDTTLQWDRWVDEWLELAADASNSMWCFGSMRMFLAWRDHFAGPGWNISQDVIGVDEDGTPTFGDVHVIWEKHNGSGFATDRFRRVHEHILHWSRGPWKGVHHTVPRVPATYDAKGRTASSSGVRVPHTGTIGAHAYTDDGLRLMRSVIHAKSVRRGIHPTQKPLEVLKPLIEYGCPPGGLVLDPFAGSASTLLAARDIGRRAIGIERDEEYCEAAARALSQATLSFGEAA